MKTTNMTRLLLVLSYIFLQAETGLMAQEAWQWPQMQREARPYTRWWWMGSAVDSAGLQWNLEELSRVGFGGVEITPIYGVQGNEANDIPYLSARWMHMLQFTETVADRLDMDVDMTTGTGWPWGGPNVTLSQSAAKMIIHGEEILTGRTKQLVKRAAPGGEGYVIDHFDSLAVHDYLARFDSAFFVSRTRAPHSFFCDSYEVYGADWTPRLLDEFERRRGYRLQDHYEPLLHPGTHGLVGGYNVNDKKYLRQDYRETLGELLLDNFTKQWTEWAHRHGTTTRCQAHGSPANLLDIYAAVDIPECESFGMSDFAVKGLRTDSAHTRRNDSDLSMLKYASSAAHMAGKRLTSSETFTWLTEHFRTSLSQCKPELDLMFVAGVNHVFFHGICYSPKDEAWPGRQFYASVDMSPQNPEWQNLKAMNDYISRCQSMLQWGEPDNELLVYLPYYDMIAQAEGSVTLFDIHSMPGRAPRFIEAVNALLRSGFDLDYVSDRMLQHLNYGETSSASRPIIIPCTRYMPLQTLRALLMYASAGGKVIFVSSAPEGVPGFGRRMAGEQTEFESIMNEIKQQCIHAETFDDVAHILQAQCGLKAEPMRTQLGLSCIRRSNESGHHYFVSNLTSNDVDSFVGLGVDFADVLFFNPMTGAVTHPQTDGQKFRLQLASGESLIIKTLSTASAKTINHRETEIEQHCYFEGTEKCEVLKGWTLSFPQAAPTPIKDTFRLDTPCSWTELPAPALRTTMATGCYRTTFFVQSAAQRPPNHYVLDLGDVRESARVVVNGQEAGTVFAVPFRLEITPFVKAGKNTLEIYVTNLPANRIAEMDRQGIEWRRFKDANVVDINYKNTTYGQWAPMPSGLCSEVVLKTF